ncbi:MAG: arylformamidase [Chthoniobacter sp.]|jgi:kynurenine formamidase|nr:arylformamidase [Chthoniobacter sp.]
MRFIDLSHPLRDGLPAFPSDPQLRIEPHLTVAKDRCNVSRIVMGSHQGTHLDAMFHFLPEGRTIDAMPLEWFYGPARCLRIPKRAREEITVEDFARHEAVLAPGARVVINTGWSREFGTARFFEDFPSMTQEAARYLAGRKLRLIGMDMPTPGRDYYEIHHTLLAPEVEMVIVESLANLDELPDEFTFIGFPLRFAGGDGSPIRAVAVVP